MDRDLNIRRFNTNNGSNNSLGNATGAARPNRAVGGVQFKAAGSRPAEPSRKETVSKTTASLNKEAASKTGSVAAKESVAGMKTSSKESHKSHKGLAVFIGIVVLVAAGVGIFFAVKNMSSNSGKTTGAGVTNGGTGGEVAGGGEEGGEGGNAEGGNEETGGDPDYKPTLGGDFTASEQREEGYYLEVQVNGKYSGTCEFSIVGTEDEAPTKSESEMNEDEIVSICGAILPYKVESGKSYTIEANIRSGEENIHLSKNITVE